MQTIYVASKRLTNPKVWTPACVCNHADMGLKKQIKIPISQAFWGQYHVFKCIICLFVPSLSFDLGDIHAASNQVIATMSEPCSYSCTLFNAYGILINNWPLTQKKLDKTLSLNNTLHHCEPQGYMMDMKSWVHSGTVTSFCFMTCLTFVKSREQRNELCE